MKKFLLALLGIVFIAQMVLAAATNFYTVPRTTYTTIETTIIFPWKTLAISVINYAASNVLLVSYQGRTAEVDPTVNPILELNDVMFSRLGLRYKTGTGEAHVISLH